MKLTPIQGWRSTISRRVSEKEIRRQMTYNNIRKYTASHNSIADYVSRHVPVIWREFISMLVGSLIVFWMTGKLILYVLHVSPLYIYALFGLLYAFQTTYYKYRLSVDPDYRIPKCRCHGRQNENMERVLKSGPGTFLRVPNSVFAILYYSALLIMGYSGHSDLALPVAVVALCVSAYLSYVMVIKIGSLCANCVNISALNMLILLQILF